MLNFFRRLFRIEDNNFGVARSSNWPRLRKEHLLKYPFCVLTGTTKKLNVHHILPVWLFPEEEENPDNFITLSGDKIYGVNPHQWFGHLGNFKLYNPNVREDVLIWAEKLRSTALTNSLKKVK